jgi:hypothetical protein
MDLVSKNEYHPRLRVLTVILIHIPVCSSSTGERDKFYNLFSKLVRRVTCTFLSSSPCSHVALLGVQLQKFSSSSYLFVGQHLPILGFFNLTATFWPSEVTQYLAYLKKSSYGMDNLCCYSIHVPACVGVVTFSTALLGCLQNRSMVQDASNFFFCNE